MKIFLIVASILITLPTIAACPLDTNGELTCSTAQFQKPMDMTYSTSDSIKEYSGTPEARLKPTRNEAGEKMLRTFGPTSKDYNYNADCQFGVCYDKGENPLFLQGDKLK